MLPLTEMGDAGGSGASVACGDGREPGSLDSGGVDPKAHAAEPRIRTIPSVVMTRARGFMAFLLE
jgi:hypothetical protein